MVLKYFIKHILEPEKAEILKESDSVQISQMQACTCYTKALCGFNVKGHNIKILYTK